MGLPKPTEENIDLTQQDLKRTQDMEKLTKQIDGLIEAEENEITNFYKHFQSFELWLKQNVNDVDKLRDMMGEKLYYLKEHVKKSIQFVNNVLLMTRSEEKLGSQNIMTMLEIAKDFATEEDFAKQLNYPKQIIRLADQINHDLELAQKQASEDLKIEHNTESLLQNILTMLQRIEERLSKFEDWVLTGSLEEASERVHVLVEDIGREKAAFDKLSEFEKQHLNLLMNLYDKEKDAAAKEAIYADDAKKYVPQQ